MASQIALPRAVKGPTVAPRAGAWIETAIGESLFLHQGEKEVGVK